MNKKLSSVSVKNNILRLLKIRNWSVTDLEKKIGGTRNINNILHGRSKYPTIELLCKVADAFNVEIQELIYEYNNEYNKINHPLLLECFVEATNALLPYESKYKITPYNVLFITNEAYKYSEKLGNTYVDKEFVNWVISKYYKKLD
jgi:transcriptional regulator with XRE-family HTH domain